MRIKANKILPSMALILMSHQSLWDDPGMLEIPFKKATNETRFLVIAIISQKHWSAIITYRGKNIRIISVRRSRIEEVNFYES